ncbi:HTH-type transcriptional repressor [Nocardiopsis terrae]|uniref:AcrR family transcriptional regulator n=1 Tax=Nocardiopsis terrae TaxID=372655 RepID=A0ABR9HKV7_9ACTN|nr:TetR family transcriptional regulator [Nocardiopsis terrae]MBE1459634.1 AcrR family transcriptional regulator [Nocardiopsis terrae]GHC94763.1 HTH-type transcriptional repressor [Nocardiopsis terrae]
MSNTSRTENTRTLLLQAARHEFAAHGIAGARVDRIAERAGVNKQRIYAHFGDKEQLFRHVVGGAVDELSQAVTLTDDSDPASYVTRIFDYHRSHPDLLRLLLWEALHYGDSPVPGEEERAGLYDAKVASLTEAMGGSASGTDARHLLLTLIGLAAWPQITPQLTRLVLGRDPSDEEVRDQMREHLEKFTRNAAAPPTTSA